jgi:hypothetical protein
MTSFTIEAIFFKLHHVWQCVFPHEHNEVGVSLLKLWVDRICIKKKPQIVGWGRPIFVYSVENKMLKAI